MKIIFSASLLSKSKKEIRNKERKNKEGIKC